MIPEIPMLPELPKPKATTIRKPTRSSLPAIGSEFTMSKGRQQAAEEYAAAMGQAFQISRIQAKRQKAKARARGRAAQRAAEKRKRR